MVTIEDVIVQKEVLAGRVKDRGDLRAVLAADHAIDETYIEHWTDEFDVADRWVEAKTWR